MQRQRQLGVIITNLGTPDAATPAALRRYLGEFLADQRVVNLPKLLWWPILHGVILRLRPRRSAQAYQKIWSDEGSPLLAIAKRQTRALQHRFADQIKVVLGMRYGNPSIKLALETLREAGIYRVLVIPLYPQYSVSTTASTFDALANQFRHWQRLPELRFVTDYYDHEAYIEALAASVETYWHEHGRGDRLLMSFHGTPESFREAGDPYYYQCKQTAQLLANRLQLSSSQWQPAFQSRFGPQPWLQPYADEALQKMAADGVGRVDVICPGFSADCLETLEEIDMQNRELFVAAGGGELHYIPALNDRPEHIDMLEQLVNQHLQGWLPISEAPDQSQVNNAELALSE